MIPSSYFYQKRFPLKLQSGKFMNVSLRTKENSSCSYKQNPLFFFFLQEFKSPLLYYAI